MPTYPFPPRVVMENISKSYGAIAALRGVNLSLEAGEVLAIVGDNAAGKSTLTKILSGAVVPDGGRILLDGDEIKLGSPREARSRRIEMVYQDLALCDTLDVASNLFLGREPLGGLPALGWIQRQQMHRDARRILAELDIHIPYTQIPVAQLSGGQRQSIAIGRAVSFRPTVLIMDEPTSALAVAEVQAVLRLIRKVSHQGVGVVLVTHRLQDIFEVCDRVMVMYEGRNIAERSISDTSLEEVVRLIMGGVGAHV